LAVSRSPFDAFIAGVMLLTLTPASLARSRGGYPSPRDALVSTLNEVKTGIHNPLLANDPRYLANHPRFANLLQSHPGARQKTMQGPVTYFEVMQYYADTLP